LNNIPTHKPKSMNHPYHSKPKSGCSSFVLTSYVPSVSSHFFYRPNVRVLYRTVRAIIIVIMIMILEFKSIARRKLNLTRASCIFFDFLFFFFKKNCLCSISNYFFLKSTMKWMLQQGKFDMLSYNSQMILSIRLTIN
jgi:hypothetical protein